MKKLIIQPDGWPCTLAECRRGLFVFHDELCLKDEYGHQDDTSRIWYSSAYCDTGEVFWGGAKTKDDREKLVVQPVEAVWEESVE